METYEAGTFLAKFICLFVVASIFALIGGMGWSPLLAVVLIVVALGRWAERQGR